MESANKEQGRPRCATCQHFWETSPLQGGADVGECHYDPPQLLLIPIPGGANIRGQYPPAATLGGCRHHQGFQAWALSRGLS